MALAVKTERLSKAYQLGEFSTGTISRDIERWWYKLRGKEDPFLKIGQTNDRTIKGTSDIVWSLRDVDFEIEQGSAVGIVGGNGAGKSTLLKILSRVTSPTTGGFKVKGRIASLLEVGTGFHPELTGKENIFLNGAILGMRKNEIKRKFDEIVDFAGVERYIDTPVKRYSSGMYVRLAFAVAAHLESEILIVDEVLAVGDAEFQKKCLGKMKDVSENGGRTVLFVSHNMEAVSRLCNKGLFIKKGQVAFSGGAETAISKYLDSEVGIGPQKKFNNYWVSDSIKLLEVRVVNEEEQLTSSLSYHEDIGIEIQYEVKKATSFTHSLNVFDNGGTYIFSTHDITNVGKDFERSPGRYKATAWIPKKLLKEGSYRIGFAFISYSPFEVIGKHEVNLVGFNTFIDLERPSIRSYYAGHIAGTVMPDVNWSLQQLEAY